MAIELEPRAYNQSLSEDLKTRIKDSSYVKTKRGKLPKLKPRPAQQASKCRTKEFNTMSESITLSQRIADTGPCKTVADIQSCRLDIIKHLTEVGVQPELADRIGQGLDYKTINDIWKEFLT